MRIMLGALILVISSVFTFGQNHLKVTITDIRSDKGDVKIAVYNDRDSFPTAGKFYTGTHIKAIKGAVEVEFKDLPSGEYVVMAFHDEDLNGEVNKNFFGLPIEGFGYSIKGEPEFRPPAWEKGVFRIPGTTEILVRLVY